jgi:hypothetical protein
MRRKGYYFFWLIFGDPFFLLAEYIFRVLMILFGLHFQTNPQCGVFPVRSLLLIEKMVY